MLTNFSIHVNTNLLILAYYKIFVKIAAPMSRCYWNADSLSIQNRFDRAARIVRSLLAYSRVSRLSARDFERFPNPLRYWLLYLPVNNLHTEVDLHFNESIDYLICTFTIIILFCSFIRLINYYFCYRAHSILFLFILLVHNVIYFAVVYWLHCLYFYYQKVIT